MEAFIFTLFVLFMFGGMVLILAVGYTDRKQDSSSNSWDEAFPPWDMPTFFTRLGANGSRHVSEEEDLDESVVVDLEKYLEKERALADQFVCEPSVENLYRQVSKAVGQN